MGDDFDDQTAMWGVPLDEPPATPSPAETPPPAPPAFATESADESFLLRGDDPPSDGVYRPRLRGFGDAA